MPTIELSAEQCRLLTDVIDLHVEGVVTSKELTTDDPTIDSAEQLLDLMANYDEDLAMLNQIRHQLNPKQAIPLTIDERFASERRWDEAYKEGQRRKNGSGT